MAEAFAANTTAIRPVKMPTTIAHSLAIGNPADGYHAVKIAQDTGGIIESVTDEEVVEAIKLLASTEGVFTEPAGGVTIATLKKLAESGQIAPDEVTVAYVTGNGLKAQEGGLRYPRFDDPDYAARRIIRRGGARTGTRPRNGVSF